MKTRRLGQNLQRSLPLYVNRTLFDCFEVGGSEREEYKSTFNTVLTRELLLQLLGGEMKKVFRGGVVGRAEFPSPGRVR